MKKLIHAFFIPFILGLLLAACSASSSYPTVNPDNINKSSNLSNENTLQVEVIDDTPIMDTSTSGRPPKAASDEALESAEPHPGSEEDSEEIETHTPNVSSEKTIVWIGDSLTQGSLGDDNDNLANAPYEKLKKMVNVPVEGYGMYGFNTHDALWTYTAENHYNQIADPDKIYIFWLGSNDWVTSEDINSDTEPVINEIDRFLNLEEGGIRDYIVMGTTSRWRLGDLYIPINKDLAEHYGEHYMDVIDIINKYGYSPDNTHLSQESYDAVAVAVYEKLKALGYI